MALGVLAAGPLGVATGSMAGPLASASLPAVTVLAMALVGAGAAGPAGAYTAPVMASGSVAGLAAPLHDGQWFDRIHVVPRAISLGNVTNDRVLYVEVWNAHRKGFKLWDIAIAGNDGVWYDGVTPVAEFGALHSEIHTVLVYTGGTLPIDNVLTWVFRTRTGQSTFVAVATPGSDLTLEGTRMLLFTARPNGSAGVRERYGYPTNVLAAWDGGEQRVQLRERPRREQRFAPTFVSAGDALEAMAKLYLGGSSVFAVPFWPDAAPLAAAVSPGATAVYVETAGRAFAAGGNALLWRDQWTAEAFAILEVFADRLTVSGTIAGSFAAAGTLCAPLLPMRLLEAAPFERAGGQVASLEVAFSEEGA